MDHVVIEPDDASFRRLERALEDEADGKEWRVETSGALHAALEPGVAAVRGAVMGMATGGLPHAGEPLRATVAQNVEILGRSDGKSAGALIRVKRTYGLRGFVNAPKRLNQRRGWTHPTRGGTGEVTQRGAPGWFDDTLQRLHPALRAAAEKALDARARRISRRAPG